MATDEETDMKILSKIRQAADAISRAQDVTEGIDDQASKTDYLDRQLAFAEMALLDAAVLILGKRQFSSMS